MTKLIYKSDYEYNFEETKQDLAECRECPVEEITDDDVYEHMYFLQEMDFDAERSNLNKELDGKILCIADVGTWRGRRTGYKMLGSNLNEVIYSQVSGDSTLEVSYDGNNVIATEHHHDGTNYYTFREVREETNYENLLDKIYNQEEVSRSMLNKYTKSLRQHVKQIYGW